MDNTGPMMFFFALALIFFALWLNGQVNRKRQPEDFNDNAHGYSYVIELHEIRTKVEEIHIQQIATYEIMKAIGERAGIRIT